MASLHKWLDAVEAFQTKILGNKKLRHVTYLDQYEMLYTYKHISEELEELAMAKDVYAQADALFDTIYVALGGLFKMGLAPGELFHEVHAANMRKIGAATSRTKKDAAKPADWIGPDIRTAVEKALAFEVEPPQPELFKRVQAKTAQRGKSYNNANAITNIEVEDYFPFNHASYAQMVWLKALRLVATVGRDLENPSLPDCAEHVIDATAYLSFYFDFIMAEARNNVHVLDNVEEKLAQ